MTEPEVRSMIVGMINTLSAHVDDIQDTFGCCKDDVYDITDALSALLGDKEDE